MQSAVVNCSLVLSARTTVARGVDLVQVHTNFEIGRHIVEYARTWLELLPKLRPLGSAHEVSALFQRRPLNDRAMYILDVMPTDQTLIRTQIYLTQAQQKRLALASRGAAVTKSELIRRAIDQFLDQQPAANPAGKAQRLSSIAGLWAGREDMADPSAYVRQLRAPRF